MHSRHPKLLLDVDGILTDFHAAVANVAAEAGFPVSVEQMPEWGMSDSLRALGAPQPVIDRCMTAMGSDGFNEKLEPDPDAVRHLPLLRQAADVTFVTSPNPGSSTWMSERVAWMRRHFDVEPRDIVFSCDKRMVSGDAFVDDNPQNVLDWAQRHPSALSALWDKPYNKSSKIRRRIRSWPELVDMAIFLRHR